MKDTFNTHTSRDFSQRYRGCYAWFLTDKNRILTKITNVDNRAVTFVDQDNMVYIANINSGAEWEFTQVERGWHLSDKGEAFYFYRIPQRQFSRGITSENTGVMKLTNRLQVEELSYEVVSACFNNQYSHSLDDIAVMSKHFAKNKTHIYMFNTIIGTVKQPTFHLSNPLFAQELGDVLRRNNFSWEVQ